ncbi:hypothetical protein ABVT39_019784 [Epinephelus coioides]
MAGQGTYNQPPSNINLYDMAQPGPSQVKNLWEGHPGNVAPPPSQYMTPKVPEPQPIPMMSQPLQSDCTEDKQWMAPLSCPSSETASSSEDVPETDAEGPLPPLMSYSPTSPPVNEPQPKPDPPQPVPVNAHKPLPQTPMSRAIRAWLQQDYKVCPEVSSLPLELRPGLRKVRYAIHKVHRKTLGPEVTVRAGPTEEDKSARSPQHPDER